MKKFRLVLAMLALALVVGMAFVGCGSKPEEKTIETLFEKVKSINVGTLFAYDYNNRYINYCRDHRAWESRNSSGALLHGEPPLFTLAEARNMGINMWFTNENITNRPALADLVRALDSFYTDEYKTNSGTYNATPTSMADGTTVYAWVMFSLRRDGFGAYGSSMTPVQAPTMADTYQF